MQFAPTRDGGNDMSSTTIRPTEAEHAARLPSLDGRVAIVTGAASGIGRATAELLHRAGATLVAVDRDATGLARMPAGDGIHPIVADVSDPADVERLVSNAIERFGRIDALCNIAGIVDRLLPVGEVTDEVWEHVLAVNLTGPMLTMRAVLPSMVAARKGVILNVSSVGGLFGARGGAAYAASKHGLIGLTQNVAATYAAEGIRAVAVCPGAVETGISLGGEPSPRGLAALKATLPANPRTGSALEIANLILFLASDDASFVNGAAIVIDGGWTAS